MFLRTIIMTAILLITNGVKTVNLLDLNLISARLASADVKADGVWYDSPLTDGRQPAIITLTNVISDFVFSPSGNDHDIISNMIANAIELLESGVRYFTSGGLGFPTWIEAKAEHETNSRYAIVYNYSWHDIGDPYQTPFSAPSKPMTADETHLYIEHEKWSSSSPNNQECVAISTQFSPFEGFEPTASADDAYTDDYASTIYTSGNTMEVGSLIDPDHTYAAGIRFRNVTIPQGAQILSAKIKIYGTITIMGTYRNFPLIINGERSSSPAAFSTFNDFYSRNYTENWKLWVARINNTTHYSPDIKEVVQEIVDLPGWSSGDDMALFIHSYYSDHLDYFRQPYLYIEEVGGIESYDASSHIPTLEISWVIPGEYGRGATCDAQHTIPNKRSDAQIHYAWRYDQSLATYVDINSLSLPQDIFPSTPAVGDALILMSDGSLDNGGPFDGAVFYIGDIHDDLNGFVWEYSDGAAGWKTLTVVDNTGGYDGASFKPFYKTGWNVVYFIRPSDWGQNAINGVTGYAIRLRLSVVGASPSPPTQTVQNIYSPATSYFELTKELTDSDYKIPMRLLLANFNSLDGNDTNPSGGRSVFRVYAASRSLSRGGNFTPYLNVADKMNPPGLTTTAGTATTFSANSLGITGHNAIYNPAGIEASAVRATLTLNSTLSQNYKGKFRMFLRSRQYGGGTLGAFEQIVKVYIGGALVYTSPMRQTKYYTTNPALYDLGIVQLPPLYGLFGTQAPFSLTFEILVACTDSSSPDDLILEDLILFPVDEWYGEFYDPVNDQTSSWLATYNHTPRMLDIDSITSPVIPLVAILRDALEVPLSSSARGGIGYLPWIDISSGMAFLQPNEDQRIFVLTTTMDGIGQEVSYFDTHLQPQVYMKRHFKFLRGNR